VFPFIKTLGAGKTSSYAKHMASAIFLITNAGMLKSVIDQIDDIPMKKRDTKGDLYEYMLSKIASAGQNGQFRTPRHIIQMMVHLTAPKPADTICDPSCGTAGFLVEAGEYLRETHKEIFHDAAMKRHFNEKMFHGYDFDGTMLRIGSMNMMLHGIEDPKIASQDSLSEIHSALADAYTLVLANPPFKGAIDYDAAAKNLLKVAKTKKTELLFVTLILRILKLGGRAAVIIPSGVLFGSSKAHKTIRKNLVESHKLEGVISMPSGVFKPYAGVSTAILLFTKTGTGGTDHVWFYDMQADGYSLDDKRNEVEANDIPDILAKWKTKNSKTPGKRTEKAFFVPKKEIADNAYDLSINRYKEIVYEEVKYDPPKVIIGKLRMLEAEIRADLDALEGMLG
jgi:type I restriction enzyme M protein